MVRTALLVSAVALVVTSCSGGSSERASPPGPTSRLTGPCTPRAGGLACAPGESLVDQIRARLLTPNELGRERYRRTHEFKPEQENRVPACDMRYEETASQAARVGYFTNWRDFPGHRDDPPDIRRYVYQQIAVVYDSPAQRETAFRKAWDSKCRGEARWYVRSTGNVEGWAYARRTQAGKCERGGVCVYVVDYLRRGNVMLVTILAEGGYYRSRASWEPMMEQAARFRGLLVERMRRLV